MLSSFKILAGWIGRDEKGASAIEYAILVAAIGIALASGAKDFGEGLSDKLGNLLATVEAGPV